MILKLCAKIINNFKKKAFSADSIEHCRKSPQFFTRRRKFNFPTLILFLINFIKGSIQDELDQFFKVIFDTPLPEKYAVSSALCQARDKLIPETFQYLGQVFIDIIYKQLPIKRWKGYRLVAVDGSTIRLPDNKSIRSSFGGQSNSLGCFTPMAKVLSFFDPLNRFTLYSTFNPYQADERYQLFENLKVLSSKDLLLLDRGFPAFWLFSALLSRKMNFLCRLPIGRWRIANDLVQSGKTETIVTLKPDARNKRACKELDLPISPITLRLVLINIKADHPEVLITTLIDNETYTASELGELYHQRWFVEEDFKLLKKRVWVESFPAINPEAITHHYYATLLARNIAALLWFFPEERLSEAETTNKLKYQINKTLVLSKVKDTLVLLFAKPARTVGRLLNDFLHIVLTCTSPIRPNRSNPRNKNKKSGLSINYKPIR